MNQNASLGLATMVYGVAHKQNVMITNEHRINTELSPTAHYNQTHGVLTYSWAP